jgi:hypothetical protein
MMRYVNHIYEVVVYISCPIVATKYIEVQTEDFAPVRQLSKITYVAD